MILGFAFTQLQVILQVLHRGLQCRGALPHRIVFNSKIVLGVLERFCCVLESTFSDPDPKLCTPSQCRLEGLPFLNPTALTRKRQREPPAETGFMGSLLGRPRDLVSSYSIEL